jgi:putative DNA primase/helicase
MIEQIGDESVYLRLTQLKKGQIQRTDATNAQRLFREHGRDIRYNAAWKKWLVWNGSHWETDEGALIHEKGLESVRNIYDDILKTDDWRERLEIEKYAMLSESMRRREAFVHCFSQENDNNL